VKEEGRSFQKRGQNTLVTLVRHAFPETGLVRALSKARLVAEVGVGDAACLRCSHVD